MRSSRDDTTDNDPFLEVEAYYAGAYLYRTKNDQEKGKGLAEDEYIQSHQRLTINQTYDSIGLQGHGYLSPLRSAKEGKDKKLIIFHAWVIWKIKPKTKGVTKQARATKIHVICSNKNQVNMPKSVAWLPRLKTEGKPFEEMLSLEKIWALTIAKVLPKDAKGLAYRHQFSVFIVRQPSALLEPLKDNEDDLGDEESESVILGTDPSKF